jgi:GT2 family glycosyltransferase
MSALKPEISIVIINKDDLGIADTLKGLSTTTKPALTEIIVVDASNPEVMADIRAKYPDVHWIPYRHNGGPKSSIPEQRNVGVTAARGNVIAFIDANCVPEKQWLTDLTSPIISGEEKIVSGWIGGANPKTLSIYNPTNSNEKYRVSAPSGNLAFTRMLYLEVGGFDESLHFGSDVDFTWRCIDLGEKIRYESTARITHDSGTTKDEIKRAFRYGRAKLILYDKHPQRVKPFAEDMFIPMYLGYLLFMPLTLWFPMYPLVIALPMLRNAKKRPFKTAIINFVFTMGFAREAIHRFLPVA